MTLIDDKQLAALRGLSNADMAQMVRDGTLPQPIRRGRRWYWPVTELARHLNRVDRAGRMPATCEAREQCQAITNIPARAS